MADSDEKNLLKAEAQKLVQYRFNCIRGFISDGVPLAQLAKEHDVSVRTLWRWIQDYRNGGLFALARKSRNDRGARRKLHPDLESLIEGLCLRKPPATIAFVFRKVEEVCQRQGWKCPSYSAVYDIARSLDKSMLMLAHEGSKAYKEKFELVYRRESTRPNEIWQADHKHLDCLIIDSTGKPKKPWLTAILDDYSRAIAGYFIAFEAPSAMRTALALRQAIWRKQDPRWHIYGLPDQFYTDHGSDFTSLHIQQVATDLKFEAIFSTVGEPRGRGKMERFFRTVDDLFLNNMPGYAPRGEKNVVASLTLDELDVAFKEWLLSDYSMREHSEIKSAPMVRWESFGFIPRMVDSLEQLDLLLLTVVKPRKVHPDGIHFQGFRYMDVNLAGFVGESVIIRYDPRDLAEIMVYSNNRFLCRAICRELADTTLSLKSLIKARNERRKDLQKSITSRKTIVDRFLEVHKSVAAPSPVPAQSFESKGGTKLKRYATE